jgi:hypothetical protein
MMYHQYEKRKVTERRDNAIFKTKVLYTKWFQYDQSPEQHVQDDNGEFWCYTGKTVFQAKEPT